MTLDQLEVLARAQAPQAISYLLPLIACVRAADELLGPLDVDDMATKYDRARAALDRLP